MLRNYFKVAFRSLLKFKGYSLINITGLSLGLIAGIVILLYVTDELSFDQFHEKKDRLYRVNTVFAKDGKGGPNETNGWPIGKILEKDFPEVEAVLYTRSANYLLVNHEGKRFREKNHYASPEFFELFSFPLLKGNPATALQEPYTVVISENMEKKYFGDGDALNKTLTFADSLTFVVTGVMKDIPSNSHIQTDMVTSFATYQRIERDFGYDTGWGQINMRNYVLLKEGTDATAFAAKTKNIYMDNVGELLKGWGVEAYLSYEPMTDVYLKTKSGNGMGPVGSLDRIYLLTAVGFFVIILACINFINLATARSVYRSKEVGLRKVVGSSRKGLIFQFLSESASITAISLVVGLAFLGALLPYFNNLLEKNYTLAALIQPEMLAGMVILFFAITLLSGYYPAWVLSAMKPAEVLKGKIQTSTKGIQLRRSLVVIQFAISTGLVMGTFIVLQQLNYMQEQDLGFSKDQVIAVNIARVNAPNPSSFETFKDQVRTLAGVTDVSLTNALPGSTGWQGQVAYPEGKTEESVSVEYVAVDDRYLSVLGLELIAGRAFDRAREADLKEGLILNESAVTAFGWSSPEDALGKRVESPSGTPAGEVIGVVKNYHQEGLQQKIDAITLAYAPQYGYLYAIRYDAKNTQQLISQLSELWNKQFPGFDFNYFFLNESFERQYQAENKIAKVFSLFAVTTIIIALIGLLGLVSFMIAVRTKEIGIRKILGANISSIIRLITSEFVILVVIASVIATPLIWYLAQGWLEKFAYRMNINPWVFLTTLGLAVFITVIAVSLQAIKAALANPIDSLRNE